MLFKLLLVVHIVSGGTGLLSGLLTILRKKGDKIHQRIGLIFYYSMLMAGSAALFLSTMHPNYFLFMVGVFTLYMVISGQAYVQFKPNSTSTSTLKAKIASMAMLIAGIIFIGFGTNAILNGNLFGLVLVTFGLIGLLFVRQDYLFLTQKNKIKNYWLIAHLQRMTGSFIASLTAFLVVNTNHLSTQIPGYIFWLLPTVIFTPLIIYWSGKFEVKNKHPQ